MIQKYSAILLAAALALPAVAADRANRTKWEPGRYLQSARAGKSTTRAARSRPAPGSAALSKRGEAVRHADGPGQAPGVVQINEFDSAREAYFVVTETIPKDSTINFWLVTPVRPDDPNDTHAELQLETLVASEDLPPGFSFYLPAIRTLGDFWRSGLTTYEVDVTTGGTTTVTSLDFGTSGFFRNLDGTNAMVPGINSTREYINDNNVMLEIKGRFTSNPKLYVVLEDIVAPPDAVYLIDSSTVVVNLSLVPNFDTALMKGYLLTVGQDTWSDTTPYRFTPLQ